MARSKTRAEKVSEFQERLASLGWYGFAVSHSNQRYYWIAAEWEDPDGIGRIRIITYKRAYPEGSVEFCVDGHTSLENITIDIEPEHIASQLEDLLTRYYRLKMFLQHGWKVSHANYTNGLLEKTYQYNGQNIKVCVNGHQNNMQTFGDEEKVSKAWLVWYGDKQVYPDNYTIWDTNRQIKLSEIPKEILEQLKQEWKELKDIKVFEPVA